jgi:phosphomevalonate kinase
MSIVEAISSDLEKSQVLNLIKEFKASFDYKYTPFNLPSNFELLMIDVNSGSDTKVLVKQVMDWEK